MPAADEGRLAHAGLTYDTGIVMCGSRPEPGEPGRLHVSYRTTGVYVVVEDPDAHSTAPLPNRQK